jgi:hypothetical protein
MGGFGQKRGSMYGQLKGNVALASAFVYTEKNVAFLSRARPRGVRRHHCAESHGP